MRDRSPRLWPGAGGAGCPDPIRHFPQTGFAPTMVPAGAAAALELGLIGREEMLGATIVLGVDSAPRVGPRGGEGTADDGRPLPRGPGRFRTAQKGSAALLLRAAASGGAAGGLHAISHAHGAARPVAADDAGPRTRCHIPSNTGALGAHARARRVGVTNATGPLQDRGPIGSYRRGDLAILNRRGLERASCACYAADKGLYAETLGEVLAHRAVGVPGGDRVGASRTCDSKTSATMPGAVRAVPNRRQLLRNPPCLLDIRMFGDALRGILSEARLEADARKRESQRRSHARDIGLDRTSAATSVALQAFQTAVPDCRPSSRRGSSARQAGTCRLATRKSLGT
jgi:hypothetical protein